MAIGKSVSKMLLLACTVVVLQSLVPTVTFGADYLVGIFGVPETDWDLLRKAGLNTVLVREDEIGQVRNVPVNKIAVLGVNPPQLKKGISAPVLSRRLDQFRSLQGVYGYYLAGDVNCRRQPMVKGLERQLNAQLETGASRMVGLLRGPEDVGCYRDYDVFFYHYPLMRKKMLLSEMLDQQIATIKRAGKRAFTFVQTHQQVWYRRAVKNERISREALLYPDGQVSRMLIHYAIATGAPGYFLYDFKSMSGGQSRERLLAAAQAMVETRALYPALLSAREVSFFQKAGAHGSVIKGPSYDIFFVFNADINSNYHPTTVPVKAALKDVVNPSEYKSVYKYLPTGAVPAGESIEIPQDHALILIGSRSGAAPEDLKITQENQEFYARLLSDRAEVLSRNIQKAGISSPPPAPKPSKEVKGNIDALLNHIDALNELKRDSWIKRSGGMPADGDALNEMVWNRKKAMSNPLNRPAKGQVFNFYYGGSK